MANSSPQALANIRRLPFRDGYFFFFSFGRIRFSPRTGSFFPLGFLMHPVTTPFTVLLIKFFFLSICSISILCSFHLFLWEGVVSRDHPL